MLLCLFDALFLKQSDHWSRVGVANTPADETPELAKWFMKGQHVGSKPIFDGICALSNKEVGPPTIRDSVVLTSPDGTP